MCEPASVDEYMAFPLIGCIQIAGKVLQSLSVDDVPEKVRKIVPEKHETKRRMCPNNASTDYIVERCECSTIAPSVQTLSLIALQAIEDTFALLFD